MTEWYAPVGLSLFAQLTDYMHEREFSEQLRAKFVRHPSGHVDFVRFEWNAARPGKPDYWVPIEQLVRHIGRLLAEDMREEIDREELESWEPEPEYEEYES